MGYGADPEESFNVKSSNGNLIRNISVPMLFLSEITSSLYVNSMSADIKQYYMAAIVNLRHFVSA